MPDSKWAETWRRSRKKIRRKKSKWQLTQGKKKRTPSQTSFKGKSANLTLTGLKTTRCPRQAAKKMAPCAYKLKRSRWIILR